MIRTVAIWIGALFVALVAGSVASVALMLLIGDIRPLTGLAWWGGFIGTLVYVYLLRKGVVK